MRITVFIVILFFSVSEIYAQKRMAFEYNNEKIETVLEDLESEFGLLFSYRTSDIIDMKFTGTIDTSNTKNMIQSILNESDLEHELVNENFVIIKKAKAPPLQTIKGQITDALSSKGLMFVNLIVSNSTIGTSTDENGYFEFTYAFESTDSIDISYIGYAPQKIAVSSFLNNENLNIGMEIPTDIQPFLVIKDYIIDGIDLEENGQATVINPSRTGLLPGQAQADVLGMIEFLPGISSPSSQTSDIHIRGGKPDQNLILWEDISIYHTAHYFGMITALDPYSISKMKIYRGGFGAEYGSRIAGVIDMSSFDENHNESLLGAGTNMTHAFINGLQKMGKDKKSSISFSLRRSFNDLFETPTFENITLVNQQGFIIGNQELEAIPDNIKFENDFNFIDGHVKYSTQLNNKDKLVIAGLQTRSKFLGEIKDNNIDAEQKDSLNLSHIGGSINWTRKWSENFETTLKAAGTSYSYNYNYKLTELGNDNQLRLSGFKNNEVMDRQLTLSGIHRGSNGQSVQWGYQLINYDIFFSSEEKQFRRSTIEDDGDSYTYLHNIYFSYQKTFKEKFRIDIGLRNTFSTTTDDFYFEPRVQLNYDFNSNLSTSFNYGRHYQFLGQITEFAGSNSGLELPIWALAEKMSIPVQQADLLQIGSIYRINSWLFDVQAYARFVDGQSSRAYDLGVDEEGEPEIGTSETRGLDIMIKKRFTSFRSWVSYSLSRTKLKFNQISKREFVADHDQTHIFQWSNQYTLNNFQIALGLKYSSGLPYTDIIDIRVENMSGMNFNFEPIYGGINRQRLDYMMEVNGSIQYTFHNPEKSKTKTYLSFSVTNALNHKNINSRNYYIESRMGQMPDVDFFDKSNLPRTFDLALRLEF